MLSFSRKIVSRLMNVPFVCAVLTACLLEAGINSAPARLQLDANIKVASDPTGMAFTPDGNYLYVASYNSNTVSVIDTALNQVSATIPVTSGTGSFLSSVAITPDGSTVFVLDSNTTSNIDVISTSTNTVIKTISAGPSFGSGLAVTPDGTWLYVSNFYGTVSIINVASGSIVKTLNVGFMAWTLAISPDGKSVYVQADNSLFGSYLAKIDIASQTIVASLGAGLIANGVPSALAFSPDSQTVYATDNLYDVLALNATTGQLENDFFISSVNFSYLGGVQVSPDGQFLYVAETTAKAIATVNVSQGRKVGTLALRHHPNSIVTSPDGTYLCVGSAGTPRYQTNGTVSVISP